MKQIGRLLTLVLALAMLLTALPAAEAADAASGKCGDNVTWRYDEQTHTLIVSGTGEMYDFALDGDISARPPWERLLTAGDEVEQIRIEKGVTGIGANAFCDGWFDSISIAEGVTRIGDGALSSNWGNMTEIVLPESLTLIGAEAFKNCNALVSVRMPDGVKSIGEGAFAYCDMLSELTIPSALTYIEDYAFYQCDALETVVIPEGVTGIGAYAFSACDQLTGVTIPSSVKQIDDSAFDYHHTALVISGYTGTAAQQYAQKQEIAFQPLGSGDRQESLSPLPASAPAISKLRASYEGVTISWDRVSGAEKYRVFRRTADGSWQRLGDTVSASYTDKKGVGGTEYTYTVRCISADGERYTSDFDKTGKTIRYPIVPPNISRTENTVYGVKLTWNKVESAAKYRVFRWDEEKLTWDRVGDVTANTIVDKTAVSGRTYGYAIRCLDSSGRYIDLFNGACTGTIRYVAAPSDIAVENAVYGVRLQWTKVPGAYKYRVFRKTSGGSWQRVGDAASAYFVDKTASSGTRYAYTVRCLDADGSYASAFQSAGVTVTYVAAASVRELENVEDGVRVTWDGVDGAAKYRVFRKTGGTDWEPIGDTAATDFVDTSAVPGTRYAYTVQCLYSGGTNASAFNPAGKVIGH